MTDQNQRLKPLLLLRIRLFGFSRGAFIARTIAEMVGEIGILNMAGMEDFYQIMAAYQLLHAKGDNNRVELGRASAQAFLDEYCQGGQKQLRRISEGALKCVGVWDMVGACGLREFWWKPSEASCLLHLMLEISYVL
jgi:uncharacterized protein (DUF2235 family)